MGVELAASPQQFWRIVLDLKSPFFDQFDTPEPVGSGLVIQPVGLRVLEQLGAAKSALAKKGPKATK